MSKIKDNEVSNEGASNGRICHVPFYGFNLRCEERALKRREFSFKLKERLYEKELERAMILNKLKEIEEEEVKMLRKSMIVRANPVPNFYHHPSPPSPNNDKMCRGSSANKREISKAWSRTDKS